MEQVNIVPFLFGVHVCMVGSAVFWEEAILTFTQSVPQENLIFFY